MNEEERAIRLLLLCLHHHLGTEERAKIEDLLHAGVDWQRLLAFGEYRNLFPLLYQRLKELDSRLIPARALRELQRGYYLNMLRNEWLRAELQEVTIALHQEGVEVIVLKGGALAWTVYASPALRQMADLDLMVRREQVELMNGALKRLGFVLSSVTSPYLLAFQQRFGGGVAWVRPDGRRTVCLDVQHHPIGIDWYRYATRMDVESLWEKARPLAVEGVKALQLSVADTIIHLCLHPAVQHGYNWTLGGYVDIDRVVAHAGADFSWASFTERVEQFGVRTPVAYGLLTACRLLETPVPPDVLEELRPSTLRLGLLRRLAPVECSGPLAKPGRGTSGVRRMLLFTLLVDRVWDAVRMVGRILFPDREWLATRYGLESEGRLFLHRLLHLLKLARAFVRGLHRPLVESGLGGPEE